MAVATATIRITVSAVQPREGLPNCDCEDDTAGRRTLGELRSAVMSGLGFYDILKEGPQKTLAQMRDSVLGALNLGDRKIEAPRSLGDIRLEVKRMTGYSAMIPSPPGFDDMLTAFINEAQQILFQRLESSRTSGSTPPAWISGDDELTQMDGAAVQTLAIGLVKAHYNKPDAQAYDKYVQGYLQGLAERLTPVSDEQIDNALKRARYTVWSRPEELPPMEGDDDMSAIHFLPIELLAIASLKERLGHKDAGLYRRDYEKYTADGDRKMPADALGYVTQALQIAQEQLYRRYDVLRTERYFSWPLVEGIRMFDIPGNQESCDKRLDPRKVSWVGIEYDDAWIPLACGIEPEMYSHNQTGRPQRYDIRQCIEVWPRPDETRGRLIIRGRFGLEPFTDDAHHATIDDQAIYLLALANAKAHYGQQDANMYTAQLETLISGLVAGSHLTNRYIPGAQHWTDRVYAMPKPSEPFN